MENNKLVSMVAFVLKEAFRITDLENWDESRQKSLTKIYNYAKFLSTPLALGQFVPCTLDNVPLEKPNSDNYLNIKDPQEASDKFMDAIEEYKEACDRVLFEGFSIDSNEDKSFLIFDDGKSSFEYWTTDAPEFIIMDGMNICTKIEDIAKHDILLVPSALKEIFK